MQAINNSGYKIELPKFSPNKWATFKDTMELIFTSMDAWEIVNGTTVEPAANATAAAKLDYKNKHWAARTALLLALGEDYRQPYKNVDSVHQLWTTLSAQYQATTFARFTHLTDQLHHAKLEEGGDYNAHVAKFESVLQQLKENGDPVEDKRQVSAFLSSLPPSYSNAVQNLKALDLSNTNVTYAIAKKHITSIAQDANIKGQRKPDIPPLKEKSEGGASALLAKRPHFPRSDRGRGRDRGRGNGCRNNPYHREHSHKPHQSQREWRCTYCESNTHNLRECRKLFNKDGTPHRYDEKRDDRRDDRRDDKRNDRRNNRHDDSTQANFSRSFAFVMRANTSNTKPTNYQDQWIVDSGASQHMMPHKHYFHSYHPLSTYIQILLGDNSIVDAVGYGSLKLLIKLLSGNAVAEANNVLHVPDLKVNLLSLSTVTDNGLTVGMKGNIVKIWLGSNLVACGYKLHSLFYLDCETIYSTVEENSEIPEPVIRASIASSKLQSMDLIHRKLGHISADHIQATADIVDGIHIDPNSLSCDFCEPCVLAKQNKADRSRLPATRRATKPLQRLHIDLCGPFSVRSLGGAKYGHLILCDNCRVSWFIHIPKKSHAFITFKEFHTEMQNQGYTILVVHSDNGKEFTSNEFSAHLRKYGIKHELTAPHTSWQNGAAERRIGVIIPIARTLLIAANLPKSFWGEAAYTSNWIVNRISTKSIIGKSPMEVLTGSRPDLSDLHVFGCKAWVYNHDHKDKLGSRSFICIYMGPTPNPGTHKLYNPATRRFITLRDVIFDDSSYFYQDKICKPIQSSSESKDTHSVVTPLIKSTPDIDMRDENQEEDVNLPPQPPSPAILHHPQHNRTPTQFFGYAHVATVSTHEPQSLAQALNTPDANKWMIAAKSKMKSLEDMEVYTLVDLPPGRSAISSRWTFKAKTNENGEVVRHKARLVAKGFSQQPGIDYEETYAPVARLNSMRLLFAIAAKENLEVFQMDVETAFLYGKIDKEIYMKQPEGFIDKQHPNRVWRLLRSLYGLKQASMIWNAELHSYFLELGFVTNEADKCIYLLRDAHTEPAITTSNSLIIRPQQRIYTGIHVDDIITVATRADYKIFVARMEKRFKIKDLGLAKWILGIGIMRNSSGIFLSQSAYLQQTLELFGMQNCKPTGTPTSRGDNVLALPSSISEPEGGGAASVASSAEYRPSSSVRGATTATMDDPTLYRSAVGRLMYAMVATRPDLAFAVSLATRYMSNPTNQNWELVKRIFRYIKGTLNYGIRFPTNNDSNLMAYSDADWAGDINDRKSTTGYITFLHGGPISWSSRKQPTVALSSTEAEYMSLSETSKEIAFIHKLVTGLAYPLQMPFTIYEDNESTRMLTVHDVHHNRTKHIDIRHHYIRDLVEKGMEVIYIPTAEQIADILTKPLPRPTFEYLRELMRVVKTHIS